MESETGSAHDHVLRVLVVEDLPRVQTLLRELIEEPGRFEVLAVADTESQAIAQYRELRPDAVIIDLSLRQGTGLGVISALRRDDVGSRRPLLIVLTNHAFPVLDTACRNAGADHFLDKSRDFRKVRSLLEQARVN
jgi:CheY-like chemotaxis protein